MVIDYHSLSYAEFHFVNPIFWSVFQHQKTRHLVLRYHFLVSSFNQGCGLSLHISVSRRMSRLVSVSNQSQASTSSAHTCYMRNHVSKQV